MIPEVLMIKIEFIVDKYLCYVFVVHKEKETRDNLFSLYLKRMVREAE
jgi:hypothetical protein